MECLGCEYTLAGLEAGVCPECGRPFDPDDPTTVGPRQPSRWVEWVVRLSPIAAAWPPLIAGWLHLMFGVARLVLGRWPTVWGADDPKGIRIVSTMHWMGCLMMFATPIVLAAGVIGLVLLVKRKPGTGGLAVTGVLAAWIAMFVYGNGDLMTWYMD